MKIPESIRIGGKDYKVLYVPYLHDGQHVCWGRIDFRKAEIYINVEEKPNQQAMCQTMWHEILHGIVDQANLEMPEDDEEKIIDTLSKGIYQVLQDNGRGIFDIVSKGGNDSE